MRQFLKHLHLAADPFMNFLLKRPHQAASHLLKKDRSRGLFPCPFYRVGITSIQYPSGS